MLKRSKFAKKNKYNVVQLTIILYIWIFLQKSQLK